MSLTNVHHLHQKTGTNFRVTRRDMMGDRGSQVGLVDLPARRSDEGDGWSWCLLSCRTDYLNRKLVSSLCRLQFPSCISSSGGNIVTSFIPKCSRVPNFCPGKQQKSIHTLTGR